MLVLPPLLALLPALATGLETHHSSLSSSGANASSAFDVAISTEYDVITSTINSTIAIHGINLNISDVNADILIESPNDLTSDWDTSGGYTCETDNDCSTACPVWLYGYCMAEMWDDFTPYTACHCIPRMFEGNCGFVWMNGTGVVMVQAVGV